MKILPLNKTNYSKYNNNRLSFKSLQLKDTKNSEEMYNTGFFRDIDTMDKSIKIISECFPQGGAIIVGACSNGEEIIGLKCLLGNNNKYEFIGFDSSNEILNISSKNTYKIDENSLDGFLLRDNRTLNDTQLRCKENFQKIMESEDNDTYKIKKGTLPILFGDIREIDNITTGKKVCAVYFRNAFYFLTKNYSDKSKPCGFETNIDRYKIYEDIVEKIDKILPPNGIFVIGNIPREHLILIDENTPEENKYILNSSYNKCCKESPLNICLKNKGFKPVVYSKMFTSNGRFNSDTLVPTIWQKL